MGCIHFPEAGRVMSEREAVRLKARVMREELEMPPHPGLAG